MRALIKASEERLQGIPSYQSLRFGYKGFISPAEVYALTGEPPWVAYLDPGWHQPLGGTVHGGVEHLQEPGKRTPGVPQGIKRRGTGGMSKGSGRHGPCHVYLHR